MSLLSPQYPDSVSVHQDIHAVATGANIKSGREDFQKYIAPPQVCGQKNVCDKKWNDSL
jgi:hypothetical protein